MKNLKGSPGAPKRSNFWFFGYCRGEDFHTLKSFRYFLSLRYGADLGRTRLVLICKYLVFKNKTTTSKVGAIYKAQKAKNIFLENFSLSENVAQCRKKIRRGDPLVSAGFVGYVKKVKNERRDPLETEKISKKVAQCRQKIGRGDSLVSSGFVGYLEKVETKGGPFALSLPWPLGRTWLLRWFQALAGFRIVSKKWTDQCEDCSLKKKNSHCYSRAFFP